MAGRQRRAVGIVRVSRTKGRSGETFHSPEVQRERIRSACEAHGWRLLDIHDELDVSGGKPLTQRPGLRQAVEAVEDGRASIVVAAYLDRLTRDPRVRDEAIDRVEAAGGEVFAADMGRQTNGTAVEQLTGTLASAVHRYVRRVAAERSADAQRRAVERGVAPWPNIPPGYRRGDDGVLEVDARAAKVIERAFALRAGGATIADVRDYLGKHRVKRSYHGTQAVLASRVYLGELHFGELHNLTAHPAIIDPDTFDAVQRTTVSRGRRAKSDRLLARLGVLTCGNCGRSMIAATQTQNGRRYPFYRCGAVRQDCDHRAAISAAIIETQVTDEVKALLEGMTGTAAAGDRVTAAVASLESAQKALDAAIRAFADLGSEPAAVERLRALRDERDRARDELADLQADEQATTVAVTAGDWDLLNGDERRALIKAVLDRVVVNAGRGAGRVTVVPRT